MSLTKYMLGAAVPFHIARIQNSRQVIRQTTDLGLKRNGDSDAMQKKMPQKRRRLDHLSFDEKLRMRKMKNREASQISRERARQQKEILEKQLLDLQVEKMKLLLENEQLKVRSTYLEMENENLKMSLQTLDDQKLGNGDEHLEVAIKHALFVNIPQLKERVFPQLFIVMMIAVKEIFMINLQAHTFGKVQFLNIHSPTNCMKLIQSLTCVMREMMIFPRNYFRSLILYNI